jgi:beta-galactosidase
MHHFARIIYLLLCAGSLAAEPRQAPVRSSLLFNFGWKFHAGDTPDAIRSGFDDRSWRGLDLPHDFQIEQSWDSMASPARGFKTMGVGWYRKTFRADTAWSGRRVLLDFEGIMLHGDAWLNGEKIGGTDYGYLGFEADVSRLLRYDAENVLAVRASTGEVGASRWYTGGGLYRDVHLVLKDSVAVARHGLRITTSEVSESAATVSVQVEIEGFRNRKNRLEIRASIYGPDGKLAGETQSLAPTGIKKRFDEVPLPTVSIAGPQLWSCETPHLYRAVVTLTLDGRIIDRVEERFGIRSIEFSREHGFRLNGKKVFLKGIANHSDLGALGVAAHETAIAREMDVLKRFGFNHIRTAHNPYSEAFLRLADEKGILIVDELYDKWSNKTFWAGRLPWTELWYRNVPEWIKRDRNHPSVILWSFGNELQTREDMAGFQTSDWGVTTYRILDVLAKRYDSSRPTTVAMHPSRANAMTKNNPEFHTKPVPPELATVTDVSSFNYRFLDYGAYLKYAPHMIVYQSEATTNDLAAPFFGMDREKMVGLAYWGAVAYWGESGGWPRKGWNYSYFSHALEPEPQAWLMKSIFTDTPVVRIAIADSAGEAREWNGITVGGTRVSSHWNREPGKAYTVNVYTNASQAALYLNGKLIGIRQNDTAYNRRNVLTWPQVPFEAGVLEARAQDAGGKELARHRIETAGKAVALKTVVEHRQWKADGSALQYVKVYAVDNRGRIVPAFNVDARFDISGAASLIAVDNGDHLSNELFAGPTRRMQDGFVMAILRAGRTPGKVRVKVSAGGMHANALLRTQ